MDIPFRDKVIEFNPEDGKFSVVITGKKRISTSLKAIQKLIFEAEVKDFEPFDAYVIAGGYNIEKIRVVKRAYLGRQLAFEDSNKCRHFTVYREDQLQGLKDLNVLRRDFYKDQESRRIAFRDAERRLNSKLVETKA